MPVINRRKVVPYTPQQMYNLVNNIDLYREFVPYCQKSTIDDVTHDEIRATLTFARGSLSKSFSTVNRLQPHKIIEIRLLDGPFRQLEGFWGFQALEEQSCQVSLDLEFEFDSRLVALIFGPLFEQIASRLVHCFCNRANQLYEGGDD